MNVGDQFEIAAIGDSLTTGFFLSSLVGTIGRMLCPPRRSWFSDCSGEIRSLSARLYETGLDVAVSNHARVSARVDLAVRRPVGEWLLGTRHFSHQIRRVVRKPRLPDLVLIWIGHNNLDWVNEQFLRRISDREDLFTAIERDYRYGFHAGLSQLLNRAAEISHNVTVVVFGLIDFGLFFRARSQAERARTENPGLFPYAERGYRSFKSMRPESRDGMIELARRLNAVLEDLVWQRSQEMSIAANARLLYSDVLSKVDIGVIEAISPLDAWHPSHHGHQLLADGAYAVVAQIVSRQIN